MSVGNVEMLRVLELYSGIGGMHYAMKETGVSFEVAAAVDINNVANSIYKHNFPITRLLQRAIESLSVKELDRLCPDIILMSPPCQPFCRVGKQRDLQDVRTQSFFHLLDLLPKLSKLPNYILLENVKGFDTSETRQRLLETLDKCGYVTQEFLLSPLQFGIPNSRLRYYLIAKEKTLKFHFPVKTEIWTELPACASEYLTHRVAPVNQNQHVVSSFGVADVTESEGSANSHSVSLNKYTDNTGEKVPDGPEHTSVSHCSHDNKSLQIPGDIEARLQGDCSGHTDRTHVDTNEHRHSVKHDHSGSSEAGPLYQRYMSVCRAVGDYLEKQDDTYFDPYLLPEKYFRRFWVLDIVTPKMRNSCCFTKRYAHHMEGSGSVVRMVTDNEVDVKVFKVHRVYNDVVHEAIRSIKLRYFTPREISNLMCFPRDFCFPEGLEHIQCYRVLGNSLNVHVVAVLIRLLLSGDGSGSTGGADIGGCDPIGGTNIDGCGPTGGASVEVSKR